MFHRRVRLALMTFAVAAGVLSLMSVWVVRRWLFKPPWQVADEVFGACIFGDLRACEEVIPTHVASCSDGHGDYCRQAAGFLLGGSLSPPDPREALRLLERGCSLGDAGACYAAGRLLDTRRAGRPDPAGALKAYRAACSLNHREGCHRGGLMLAKDSPDAKLLAQAEALLGVACAKGSKLACYNYMVVRCKVDKNTAFARRTLLKICDVSALRCSADRFDLREPASPPSSDNTIWSEVCAACRPEPPSGSDSATD